MYFFDQIFELFVLYRFFFAFPFAFLGYNIYLCKRKNIIFSRFRGFEKKKKDDIQRILGTIDGNI